LYHLSDMAGVSGDNTFERCVSMHVLPLYWSSNPNMKELTLSVLSEDITQRTDLSISSSARSSFRTFFSPSYYKIHAGSIITGNFNSPAHRQNTVDLSLMIKEWPIVCDYIRKHYNFYDKLESIVRADLPDQRAAGTNTADKTLKERLNNMLDKDAPEEDLPQKYD
ncbi:MAG: hypothetical protein QNK11_00095, partial [Legionella sp.]|nr:hypothetical protein [Legionella sp.]